VLNADDPRVAAMRDWTDGRVLLFSSASIDARTEGAALVAAHVREGGRAVTVEGRDELVLHDARECHTLLPIADAPLTLGGAAAFQVQNIAAATGAAWALGVAPEILRAALRTFASTTDTTPGRMNVLRFGDATVVIDYAHNVAAVTALLDYASRVPASRRIGVLGIPGDRTDDDIRALGALAAPLDVAVFKEHPDYRRGRAPGEIARLMREGLRAAGGELARVRDALDEEQGVAVVRDLLRPDDLVLYVADEPARVTAAFSGG
jgi:cyanophycin synthetase